MKRSVKNRLLEIFGKENLLLNKEDLICYAYDGSFGEKRIPDFVAKPKSYEQIVDLVRLCNEERIYLTTRGAGTNLSGGSVPICGGGVLLLTGMDKIKEINRDDLYVVCEPGVVTANLQAEVEKFDLFYPPDPASMSVSTIGGNVAENAGGLRGLKYGVTKDYVMEIKLVTPYGDYVRVGAKTVKCVTGYDIVGLMVGSEGTLGVFCEMTLKLLPKPKFHASLVATFEDIKDAGLAVAEIIREKIVPATLEIMDNFTIKAVEDYKSFGLPRDVAALILVECDGYHTDVPRAEMEKVLQVCMRTRAKDINIAKNEAERDSLWAGRRAALSALSRIKPTVVLEDVTVPRSKVPEMLKKIEEISKKYNLLIGTFGHAGDGNLHPTFLLDARDEAEMKNFEKAADELFEAAIELGGTLSGEHGIGISKSKFLSLELSKKDIEIYKRIKKALDPNMILNPKKIFFQGLEKEKKEIQSK